MAQQPDRSGEFTPACPSCQAGTGHPVSVTMQQRQRTIEFRCDRCEHTWTATDRQAELFATTSTR